MHTRAERLARGWLVGAFATGVAAVSHTLAGGYRPDPLGLGAALLFAGMLGTLAIGRRPSLARLVVAVTGSQLAFHLLFTFLGVSPAASATPSMPGMHMDMTPAIPGMPAMHDHLGHLTDPWMWLAHVVAGALTVLFLRRAETAVWGMLRRLVVRVLRPAVAAPTARPAAAPVFRVRVLRPVARVAAPPLRGPPLLPSH
ncbi:hypothetical protein [Pseudolysinimonas kribbensis]|uniref:hypothetical protein n=1 Tax=Pseudolysinimonas kribbensis TaxID=433641 RepID=UPI0024E1218A|nr:hypothetical protein [Pseudolysinimonas kribbensis]